MGLDLTLLLSPLCNLVSNCPSQRAHQPISKALGLEWYNREHL